MTVPGETRLLLVVHGSALVFLALCVGCIHCDRAALAIGRDHDVGGENDLPTFFRRYVERPGVHLFHRPRLLVRISGGGIIFPIKLTGPLTVRGAPVRRGAINGDFYAVPGRLIDNGVVLEFPSSDFRFRLVQLPATHLYVAGKAHCRCPKTQSHCQNTRSCSHTPSMANKLCGLFTAANSSPAPRILQLGSASFREG